MRDCNRESSSAWEGSLLTLLQHQTHWLNAFVSAQRSLSFQHDTRAYLFLAAHPTPHAMPNEPVSIRDDVVQHNILAAYYVMYRIFAVAQAGGAVPGGHS